MHGQCSPLDEYYPPVSPAKKFLALDTLENCSAMKVCEERERKEIFIFRTKCLDYLPSANSQAELLCL